MRPGEDIAEGTEGGRRVICGTPEATYEFGRGLGSELEGGEAILLTGALGAGKTLLTKGILESLGFDPDEVTSPSFTLVNRYDARLRVFHIDLWRIESSSDAAFEVGLDEVLEDETAVVIVEWAERLGGFAFPGRVIRILIEGDGDDERVMSVYDSASG